MRAADDANPLITLQRKMRMLVDTRNKRVQAAREEIVAANRSFDRLSVPLQRRIDKEERKQREAAAAAEPAAPRARLVVVNVDDDWSDEEKAHYIELARRLK